MVEIKRGAVPEAATSIAFFSYDFEGNRIARREPVSGQADKLTKYLVDRTFDYPQTVNEVRIQGDMSQSKTFVWGSSLIQQIDQGLASQIHADGLGSLKAMSNGNGEVVSAFTYSMYGATEEVSEGTAQGARFTGEFFDEIADLQYNRARWYDPEIGGSSRMTRTRALPKDQ